MSWASLFILAAIYAATLVMCYKSGFKDGKEESDSLNEYTINSLKREIQLLVKCKIPDSQGWED